jgi:hypothetical protein
MTENMDKSCDINPNYAKLFSPDSFLKDSIYQKKSNSIKARILQNLFELHKLDNYFCFSIYEDTQDIIMPLGRLVDIESTLGLNQFVFQYLNDDDDYCTLRWLSTATTSQTDDRHTVISHPYHKCHLYVCMDNANQKIPYIIKASTAQASRAGGKLTKTCRNKMNKNRRRRNRNKTIRPRKI